MRSPYWTPWAILSCRLIELAGRRDGRGGEAAEDELGEGRTCEHVKERLLSRDGRLAKGGRGRVLLQTELVIQQARIES